ncbi:MAG: metallophosphoesterase [Eubacterium sp.]|nr:metallophosphoesterase [Eubacterium sp.]
MSHYVVGDIHGCLDELLEMIDLISLESSDRLIMVGDYIDRGDQSVEMMKWLEDHPDNVICVRGNHDENFAYYVDLMKQVDHARGLNTDADSNAETYKLYLATVSMLFDTDPLASKYFDMYGTIHKILENKGVTLTDLEIWADMFRSFPLFYRIEKGKLKGRNSKRECVIVHAGYKDDIEDGDERAHFFLEARRPAYIEGGLTGGMVIAGHTPTIIQGEFTYNAGKVFKYVDRSKNCVFYDIDCGCVFRTTYPEARLACIRLEDEGVFYV